MTSSEERREVAERMRVYSHDFDFGDSDPFCYVAKAVFGDVDVHTYYSVFARLADLIDPTCEVEGSGPLYMDDETEFLLSCGHVADMITDCPPAFCPKCGARVVDDDQ